MWFYKRVEVCGGGCCHPLISGLCVGQKMNNDKNRFDFFSSRLTFIEVASDQLMNIDLWHYLSVFESHVYGVFMQYNRIKEDLEFPDPESFRRVPGPQAGLDIYYYTLTWDKLKKI